MCMQEGGKDAKCKESTNTLPGPEVSHFLNSPSGLNSPVSNAQSRPLAFLKYRGLRNTYRWYDQV